MIGVFGGTFNPVHQGHLRAAEEVVEALALERMLFVPSARPPHKLGTGAHAGTAADAHGASATGPAQAIAPPKLRLEWVQLAIAGNPRFTADPIEVDRPGPSYLVDTLRALAERHRGEALVFVVGQDAFAEMGDWRAPREIFRLAHVAVTTRPPVTAGHLADWLPRCAQADFEVAPDGLTARHREADTWIRELPIPGLDISGSDIRRRLREGRSVRYLMPEPVRAAVVASGCYTDDGGETPGAAPGEAEGVREPSRPKTPEDSG